MRKVGTALLAYGGLIVFTAFPAEAEQSEYLAVCDQVIAGRLQQPKAYRRLSENLQTEVFTREYVLENLVPKNEPENIAKFDAGDWSPRSVTIVVDYEAINKENEIVKKRSICEFTLPNSQAAPEADFVIVDGEMDSLR